MAENPDQPREYDAVLGDQAPLLADGAVLGGLEGVKQRLARGALEQRIDAILDAFEYGQEGLELVIQALEDTSSEVCSSAYLLLQDSTEPRAKQALWGYNPYARFECLYTLEGCGRRQPNCLAVSSHGQTLVSNCYDMCGSYWYDTVKVWDLQTGQLIHTFILRHEHMTIILDGHILVSHFQDCIDVWNLRTGQLIRSIGGQHDINSLAISPNGRTVICGELGTNRFPNLVPVWDLQTGKLVHSLHGHMSCISSLIISPDGHTLLSQGKITSLIKCGIYTQVS